MPPNFFIAGLLRFKRIRKELIEGAMLFIK